MSQIALKIFCNVLLNRMESILDVMLREKQGCSDQIFVVRHIMQQAKETRSPLNLCFVDFEKAFDSARRGKRCVKY